MEKTYEPHFIIVWIKDSANPKEGVALVKEISYREDAYQEYHEFIQRGASKIALAKLVKGHGGG